MFELLLLFIVVPVRVFTAARAGGRHGLRWALVGMLLFVCVEYGIIYGAEYVYAALAYVFGWQESFDELIFAFTHFFDIFAICCGMVAAEVLRYKLKNPDEPYYDSPPPPEMFRTL